MRKSIGAAESAATDGATKGFAAARANHTGTQLAATISDLGTLGTLNKPWLSLLNYAAASNEFINVIQFYGNGAANTLWGSSTTASNGLYYFIPWIATLTCNIKEVTTPITQANNGAGSGTAVWDVVQFNDNGSRVPGTVLRQWGTAAANATGLAHNNSGGNLAITEGTLYWFGCGLRGLDTSGQNVGIEQAAGGALCDLAPKTAVATGVTQYTQYRVSGATSGLSDNPTVITDAVGATAVRLPYMHVKVA